MDKDQNFKKGQEIQYSHKVNAGKRRTYFFDVRETKGGDFYITLTESTRRFDGNGFERHKLFLYKEDFNRFQLGLEDVINHIKTKLMPNYDYEEFDKRYEDDDYDSDSGSSEKKDMAAKTGEENQESKDEKKDSGDSTPKEDEMSW